jgi:hypothetical protein
MPRQSLLPQTDNRPELTLRPARRAERGLESSYATASGGTNRVYARPQKSWRETVSGVSGEKIGRHRSQSFDVHLATFEGISIAQQLPG